MELQFQIPLSKNDLLSSDGESYAVGEVYSLRELASKLEDCSTELREKGPTGILSEFDAIFSAVSHFSETTPEVREIAWLITHKAFSQHISQLAMVIDPEGMDFQLQMMHLNTLKMLSYLLTQLMEAFEGEATKPSINTDDGRKGRGKAGKKKAENEGWRWDNEREYALRIISQLLELDVHRLWDPPIVEEEFVNLFSSACYKFLENNAVVKLKDTKELIFHVLGILIKKYDHGLSASLKIIQLLQHFEHLVSPLAQAVETFVVEFGAKRIVADIIREIGRMDSADLSRDTSGTRSFSQFVVELADRQPSLVLPNISLLLCHLDGDSYSMRNGVLGVIGEIVVKVLSKEDLDPNLKNTRDKFLDKLEDHMHDVHAFVRSKVLQIWHTICKERAIPLSRLAHLMDLVIGRLQDKSSQVRKYAIQLIKAFLCGNPFAAKLSLEEMKKSLEKEKDKLQSLSPDMPDNQEPVDKWAKIAPNLFEALKEVQNSREDIDTGMDIADDTSIDQVIETILKTFYKKIEDGKLRDAVAVFQMAEAKWPEHFSPPGANEDDGSNAEQAENTDTEMEPVNKAILIRKMNMFEAIYKKFDEVNQMEREATENNAGNESQSSGDGESEELKKQRMVVKYLQDSVKFATQMQEAVKLLCQLLGSKTNTDILETIEFFISANEFGLVDAQHGIRKMLALVWSRDNVVKEAVVNAYKKLYIEPRTNNQRNFAMSVVQNITALTYGATLGELTSLEELENIKPEVLKYRPSLRGLCNKTGGFIFSRTTTKPLKELYQMNLIPENVLQLLWQRFSLKIPQTTPLESRSAILLLGMFAGAKSSIVKSNVDILVSNGLGPLAHQDFVLAFNTCTALLKIASKSKKPGDSEKEPFRFPEDHAIVEKLEVILVRGLHRTEVSLWSSLAMQAVNVIYQLVEKPDKICARLIKNLVRALVVEQNGEKRTPSPVNDSTPEASEQSEPSQEIQSQENLTGMSLNLMCQPKVLARVLSLVGHVAFQQLAHMEVNILSELKRRHRVQEREKESKAEKRKSQPNQSTANETAKESTSGEEGLEDELGVGGAAAEDAEAEFIRNICEKDIVTGQNLLAIFSPLLITICSNPSKYTDQELRAAACLSFSKFMLVSTEFCEHNLQLLFTILEKSKEPIIRANTIIALGDLTFRFPNLIEPWTAHLYGRLSDDSVKVRQTTVTVLTHLILNDMVKVKGQISEMALCLEDQETRIADLAKLFFTEFGRKGNALYNVLPDIISRLSDADNGVDETKFKNIMEYLLQFIQKDKQAESLVEKLCHRFRVTSTPRQWNDLAYCLAQLPFNEKCFKKLQENFACFQESLSDEKVYGCFTTIIGKAKKFIKQDLKVFVNEFEEKLTAHHNKAMDDEAGFERAAKASEKAAKRNTQKNNAGNARRKTRQKAGDDLEDSDEDKENKTFKTPRKQRKATTTKSTARRKRAKKPVVTFSSDDDEEDLFDAV